MLSIPIPQRLTKDEKTIAQLFGDIIRRALDVSINPALVYVGLKIVGNDLTIVTPGNGIVLPTRDGLHTYRVVLENNGALSTDQLT